MNLNIESNKEIPLRWEGNDYFIGNAAIVENYPLIDVSPFDPELAQKLQQHLLENQTLKLELRDGYYELPITCNPHQ
jgi:hypothetical protein